MRQFETSPQLKILDLNLIVTQTMTSSSITAIVYYNGIITTTQHRSTFVSSKSKILQLNKNMSLESLKQVIQKKLVYHMVKWSSTSIMDLLVIVFV